VNDQKKSSGSQLILIGAVVVVGLVLVFVFFNPFEGNENTERTSIRLGTTISETGRLSPEAKLYIDGRQFAIDRINDQGGIKVGDDIYPLELVQFDDQSDADTAVRLYESMIERNQVDFLLGPYSSTLVIPTSNIAEKYKIPMVQGGGASQNIFNRDFEYVFGTLPAGPDYLKPAVELFANSGAETMALIYADDAFSVDVAEGTNNWARQYGLEIVISERYASGQTEFGSLIAKLKEVDPDVVMSANHIAESISFVQQARSLGLESDLVFTVGVPTPQFHELGSLAENVFGVSPWIETQSTQGPLFGTAGSYAVSFNAKFGYHADYHNANGSIEVMTYKYAIEAANSLDPQAVRNAIASINYESFYGPVYFQENGLAVKEMVVIQIQNGEPVAVGADAENAPIFSFQQAVE